MKVKGSRRLVARLGLALAVAAIAVPSAQAVTMNSMYEGGGGVRLYADDLRAPLSEFSLPASNVRTDAASLQSSMPGSNVRTDAASSQPVAVPVSALASNVQTDAASSVSSIPITDARHTALLQHKAQLYAPIDPRGRLDLIEASNPPAAPDSSGIDWSVAGFGAALGAFGLTLLIGVLYFTGRHNRRSRLAAT
jgi:hypothetical protein